MARLLSINVGLPRDVVHTGIWKSPVDGPYGKSLIKALGEQDDPEKCGRPRQDRLVAQPTECGDGRPAKA